MTDLLDARSLLHRINPRLTALRRALAHNHDDAEWWADHAPTVHWTGAQRVTAPQAQYERVQLRWLAHLLHVERATLRGHIHGGFATLDEQRVWLAAKASHLWGGSGRYAGLSAIASLETLRTGRLVTEMPAGVP